MSPAGGENLRHLYRGVRRNHENSVARVIEQQLTGLDHLLYFSSTSSSDGSVSITVTFEQGTDPDTARCRCKMRKCSRRIAAAERSPAVRRNGGKIAEQLSADPRGV